MRLIKTEIKLSEFAEEQFGRASEQTSIDIDDNDDTATTSW